MDFSSPDLQYKIERTEMEIVTDKDSKIFEEHPEIEDYPGGLKGVNVLSQIDENPTEEQEMLKQSSKVSPEVKAVQPFVPESDASHFFNEKEENMPHVNSSGMKQQQPQQPDSQPSYQMVTSSHNLNDGYQSNTYSDINQTQMAIVPQHQQEPSETREYFEVKQENSSNLPFAYPGDRHQQYN